MSMPQTQQIAPASLSYRNSCQPISPSPPTYAASSVMPYERSLSTCSLIQDSASVCSLDTQLPPTATAHGKRVIAFWFRLGAVHVMRPNFANSFTLTLRYARVAACLVAYFLNLYILPAITSMLCSLWCERRKPSTSNRIGERHFKLSSKQAPLHEPGTYTTPSWFFEEEEAADMPYGANTVDGGGEGYYVECSWGPEVLA
ncbi:uncharacterized protein LACBIDRAFT_328283 [Laccaria bicolor S238N-H82]|uniref:Predicted protein n=1 Tax=Laccaria bicolor (strain S238N-H82 / ATCC MYA-4686) TaxID=486041 RepID=B0DEE4_LACBS|nr:uncharacterized protein LACBIDRAFT_328283 [Laccaria bicolor S238N-H82]EDR06917.1 predicted protein [Laccaria bicolor S238N-H82]|eukprot:XP_001882290.1 predicted protein [Laccaria bicolor S238N-H82]